MADHPFPHLPAQPLKREDVIAYLLDLEAQDWEIYADGNSFIIRLDELSNLRISPMQGVVHVINERSIGRSIVGGSARTMLQFHECLRQFLGGRIGTTAIRTRTRKAEPASNYGRISKLIGGLKVEAVYDPYLDDKGLSALLTIVRLTKSAAPSLRLITSRKGAKQINSHFAQAVFKELRANAGEIRKTSSPDSHRRFILLSAGKCLILGMSLNGIDKDEAAGIEDDSLDRPFFESEWSTSIAL